MMVFFTLEFMPEYSPPLHLQIIRECLDAMIPETCNIVIKSKTFEEQNVCNMSEKWFGTKYCVEGKIHYDCRLSQLRPEMNI